MTAERKEESKTLEKEVKYNGNLAVNRYRDIKYERNIGESKMLRE